MADGEVDPQRNGGYGDTPRTETVHGQNLPYRGIVDHGVPGSEPDPDDEAHHFDNARPVVYDESLAEKAPDPIPVVVVRGKQKREVRAFGVAQIPLAQGGAPYQLVGRDIRRTNVIIRNPTGSPGPIWIGPDNGVSAVSGYPLAAGEERNLGTTEPVYVITATPLVTVIVTTEYTKEYE